VLVLFLIPACAGMTEIVEAILKVSAFRICWLFIEL
jgi:hypothetical protein